MPAEWQRGIEERFEESQVADTEPHRTIPCFAVPRCDFKTQIMIPDEHSENEARWITLGTDATDRRM